MSSVDGRLAYSFAMLINAVDYLPSEVSPTLAFKVSVVIVVLVILSIFNISSVVKKAANLIQN